MNTQSEDARLDLAPQQPHEKMELRHIYLPLQTHYLDRLEDIMSRKQAYMAATKQESWRVRLLDRAIYSTLVDCIEQGVGDEAKAIAAGCDGYVSKPFSPRALLAKVREYFA